MTSVAATWRRALALLCTVVVLLGGTGLGLAAYQRAVFDRVTSQFEGEVGALVATSGDMRRAERPMGAILYQFGSDAQLRAEVEAFDRAAAQVDARIAAARAAAGPDADLRDLEAARASWDEVVAAVAEAEQLWGTDEVADALATGQDPFLHVWDALSSAQEDLNAQLELSVDRLREQTERVAARRRGAISALATTVLGAIALAVVSARRLNRRIILPVLAVTDAARRMRSGDLSARVDAEHPPGEARELGELADAVDALAAWLQHTHGELQTQATTDLLTGLPNRRGLHEYLESRVGETNASLALLFIDLDDFKAVNDTRGHAAGDALLRVVADRLRASSRGSDVVARLGGDEFAVVVEQDDEPALDLAVVLADRIIAALAAPVALADGEVVTGCSIGIAAVEHGESAIDDALRHADDAMYLAKGRGKGRAEVSAPGCEPSPSTHR